MSERKHMAAYAKYFEVEQRRLKDHSLLRQHRGSDFNVADAVGGVGSDKVESDKEILEIVLDKARVTIYSYCRRHRLTKEEKKDLWQMVKYDIE